MFIPIPSGQNPTGILGSDRLLEFELPAQDIFDKIQL